MLYIMLKGEKTICLYVAFQSTLLLGDELGKKFQVVKMFVLSVHVALVNQPSFLGTNRTNVSGCPGFFLIFLSPWPQPFPPSIYSTAVLYPLVFLFFLLLLLSFWCILISLVERFFGSIPTLDIKWLHNLILIKIRFTHQLI